MDNINEPVLLQKLMLIIKILYHNLNKTSQMELCWGLSNSGWDSLVAAKWLVGEPWLNYVEEKASFPPEGIVTLLFSPNMKYGIGRLGYPYTNLMWFKGFLLHLQSTLQSPYVNFQ